MQDWYEGLDSGPLRLLPRLRFLQEFDEVQLAPEQDAERIRIKFYPILPVNRV